jgi:hypothetical protein
VRCESCHQNGVLKGTPRDCASCHLSGQRLARGNVVMTGNHLPTTLSCDSCHNTKTFSGVRFDHQGVAAGSCASCHNGSRAGGKSANHVPYQTVGAAATAALRQLPQGRFRQLDRCPLPPQRQRQRRMRQLPQRLRELPQVHQHLGGAKVDHSGFNAATNCALPQRQRATGKSGTHIPVRATNCFSCHGHHRLDAHQVEPHAGDGGGAVRAATPAATRRPMAAAPTTCRTQSVPALASANCDTCHKSGFTAWTPAKVHANASHQQQLRQLPHRRLPAGGRQAVERRSTPT